MGAALAGIAAGTAAGLLSHPGIAAAAWAGVTAMAALAVAADTVRSLRQGRAGVDIIALLALGGALLLGQYLAGAVIALMFSGGRALERYAGARARRELSRLLDRAPRTAHLRLGDALSSVPVGRVRPGDSLLVKPGEVLPVDGVLTGPAVLDEAALTGEPGPVTRRRGEAVRSGATNAARRPLEMRATATAAESTYSAIVRLVSEAQASKAPLARLADRYALAFLPVTLSIAALAWLASRDAMRALAVLVIATPCPLILAAPVAIVGGISRAARRGIIVKGGAALEGLSRAEVLVLDKTGTVTAGSPELANVEAFGRFAPDLVLGLAASLDQVSPHVLAGPILKAARRRNLELRAPEDVHEEFGEGIRGRVNGHEVALGKSGWVLAHAALPHGLRQRHRAKAAARTSAVLVAIDGKVAGALSLDDPVRPEIAAMLRLLRRDGFRKIILLTGDHAEVAMRVGAEVGVDRVLAGCTPADKLEVVKAARAEGSTVMVGDGINDAPALAAADVGVAIGARGATAASEAADVVLLVDRVDSLVEARFIAHGARRIAIQSIAAGMALSVAGMGFAAAGYLTPLAGAVLQELIDVLVVGNALRALRTGGKPVSAAPREAYAEEDAA